VFHTIIIAGYLGRDPEMRHLPNGTPVSDFSLASTRRWTAQDGTPQEETIWVRVSAFGGQAEACSRYLEKGAPVLVEGRLRPDESGNPRTWTGQDGQVRASFEVAAQTVRFLGRREAAGTEAYDEPPQDEDIPF
jgi:single-strand DNA-binding protein